MVSKDALTHHKYAQLLMHRYDKNILNCEIQLLPRYLSVGCDTNFAKLLKIRIPKKPIS